MATEIDGTKAPRHGLFYLTLVDITSSRRSQHQANISQAALLWKRKKGKVGRAPAE